MLMVWYMVFKPRVDDFTPSVTMKAFAANSDATESKNVPAE